MPTLRLATPADLPSVIALIDAAYRQYIPQMNGRRPRPMDDDQTARIAAGELFVLEELETIVGVITFQVRPDFVHILNLAIHPYAQGRGFLHTLLEFAEASARRVGREKISLYTNAVMIRNRAIYAHLGFTETGEHDAPGGYRIVSMEKPV